ncbi:MAG: Sugar transferase, partial [bacterium 42_11]
NEALRIYEGEDRVMHISGYMFPIKKEGLPGAFFIKPTTCWGWATWKEAWKAFNREAKKWIGYFNEEEIRDFNLNHAYDYWEQLRLNYEGKIKTWAIFWYLSVYAVGGLSLHPRDSLTRNIGFDKRGTHCRELPFHRDELSYNSEWDFPREIRESSLARNRLEEYFNKIKGLSQKSAEIPNFYANLRDLIKRMIYHEGL